MSLLDRYIHEVGRFLPRKKRGSIQAELRSSVVDTLEDRYGPEPDQAQIEEILSLGNRETWQRPITPVANILLVQVCIRYSRWWPGL